MYEATWFGNEQYYQILKAGIAGGDAAVINQLFADINAWARPRAIQWGGLQDADDILMELDCRVLTHIAAFLRQSDSKTPAQRQAWLKTLLQRTCYDHVDLNRFGATYRTRKARAQRGEEVEDTALTSLESWQESGGDLAAPLTPEEELLIQEGNDLLNGIIRTACSLRVGPAEVLTFLYHNLVFFLEGESEKKGNPARTAQRLGGKTLGHLRDKLPVALYAVSGYAVPEEAFSLLDQKLTGHREEVYTFEAAKISALTSYMKRRIAEKGSSSKV